MGDFLGNIYCRFNSFFCNQLEMHLWGFGGSDYTGINLFNVIALKSFAISLVVAAVYYYVINNPRFNTWWSWLIMLVVNSGINLYVGYSKCWNDFESGAIADSLSYARNAAGAVDATLINAADCWGFGFANAIVSVGFFVIGSMAMKWWSTNCSNSPF